MTNDALGTLLPIAGWPEDHAHVVETTGGTDPILPTPFRIGETSSAALAAVGLAISDLWELRTGRRQEVSVDTRQATASLRSGKYMQMDGAAVSTERNAVMGVYPAKNGRWSYLHCNFPNHRAAALGVLGVPEDHEAVRQAVANWDALELEEAIIAAKGAGGMVRSMEEWGRHPQANAIASLPLMEIVKIGDSPPQGLFILLPGGKAPRRRSAFIRRPGSRPDPGVGRADLRTYPRGAWRRRVENHRGASTQYRLPGIRYRPRQTLCPSGSPRGAGSRDAPWSGPRVGRLLAGLPARELGPTRTFDGGVGPVTSWHRVRFAVRVQPCWAVGITPRFRHGGTDSQRHNQPPG